MTHFLNWHCGKNEAYPVFRNAYAIFVARFVVVRYGTVRINLRHQESVHCLSKFCWYMTAH